MLTEKYRCVHEDECHHWYDSCRHRRVEYLADGVVEHVGRVQSHVRGLDTVVACYVVLSRLDLHEFWDVQAERHQHHGCHIHQNSLGTRHRQVQISAMKIQHLLLMGTIILTTNSSNQVYVLKKDTFLVWLFGFNHTNTAKQLSVYSVITRKVFVLK